MRFITILMLLCIGSVYGNPIAIMPNIYGYSANNEYWMVVMLVAAIGLAAEYIFLGVGCRAFRLPEFGLKKFTVVNLVSWPVTQILAFALLGHLAELFPLLIEPILYGNGNKWSRNDRSRYIQVIILSNLCSYVLGLGTLMALRGAGMYFELPWD